MYAEVGEEVSRMATEEGVLERRHPAKGLVLLTA